MTEKTKTKEELQTMAEVLFELQLALEPIRDKALDEKARLTGYAQCAEQMIKIIVSKAEALKYQSMEKKEEIKEEAIPEKNIDSKVTKSKIKK